MTIRWALVFLFLAAPASFAENWPQFRGPTGQGISTETDLPLKWGPDENIAWKIEVPGQGSSSPMIYGDKLFLSTATDEGRSRRLICYDKNTGDEIWNVEVFNREPKHKQPNNTYASPTPITDGEWIYVGFNDGSFAALDFDGEVQWTRTDFDFYSEHGLGAAPRLYKNLLIMPFDGSSSEDRPVGWQSPWDQSYIAAMDKKTGETVWKTYRKQSRLAHVTPNIFSDENGDVLVSSAGDAFEGYNPETGELLWRVDMFGEGVTPSVVIGDELVYANSGFPNHIIHAVKPGGSGNVSETHEIWRDERFGPNIASMLIVDGLLYSVADGGMVVCRDAMTGERIYQERITPGAYWASPVYADGHIYFLSKTGVSDVIKAGREFELVATNTVDEPCVASIAISDGLLYIRSDKHLFCIDDKDE